MTKAIFWRKNPERSLPRSCATRCRGREPIYGSLTAGPLAGNALRGIESALFLSPYWSVEVKISSKSTQVTGPWRRIAASTQHATLKIFPPKDRHCHKISENIKFCTKISKTRPTGSRCRIEPDESQFHSESHTEPVQRHINGLSTYRGGIWAKVDLRPAPWRP